MLDRFVHKFINYLEIEKNASGHTVTNYKIDLRDFSESIKEKPIEQVTHLDVRLFLARLKEKNFSKRSVARKMAGDGITSPGKGILINRAELPLISAFTFSIC